jgi:hypothetical protein
MTKRDGVEICENDDTTNAKKNTQHTKYIIAMESSAKA